jgi:hypothetical protein
MSDHIRLAALHGRANSTRLQFEWNAGQAVDYAKHCVFQSQIGSDAWCEDMKDKPKGDWTANEAGDFAKHCIF